MREGECAHVQTWESTMAGDILLAWNQVALEANRRDHTGAMNAVNQRGPTRSSRALALVHLATHDAYFGLVRNDPAENPLNIPT